MTNAARHSDAENLWIVIERDGEAFRIGAHDDGRGSAGTSDGFGLRGMRGAGGESGHVSSLLAKLGVRDRTRAVLKALEAGLLHRPERARTSA